MKSSWSSKKVPLWREEFPIHSGDERYVTRRQFSKFLVLTSLAMFAGNLWILMRSLLRKTPSHPTLAVARSSQIPVGGVHLFSYPGPQDPCILVRTGPETFVAFSQTCTHLSCAVVHSANRNCLECPCHHGFFSLEDGRVLQGPPQRPLPRILLEKRGEQLLAVGVELGGRA